MSASARLVRCCLGVTALAVIAFMMPAAAGARQNPVIGIIDVYGLRTISEAQALTALGLKEGDTLSREAIAAARKRIAALPNVVEAHVNPVCCEEGKALVYVGVAERGAPALVLNPAPAGDVRLTPEIENAGSAFDEAFMAAVERGDAAEDQSQGHSLMRDPAARAIQERFVTIAQQRLDLLRRVLKESSSDADRALAAQIIAYARDKSAVVPDLSAAMRDPNPEVRNNATRALWVIAVFAQKESVPGLRVPPGPFVDMLNSVIWLDRNKSSLALATLTEPRDPVLLALIRDKALPSVVEMARWKSRGHASGPLMILGRVAGLPEDTIQKALASGDSTALIDASTKALASRASRQR